MRIVKRNAELMEDVYKTAPEKGSFAFWWLGQLGFIFKIGETVLLIDPFLSAFPDRQVEPFLAPEDLEGVDYVLGTHDHLDHIDHPVWKKIAEGSPKCRFIVSELLIDSLSRELDIPKDRFIAANDGRRLELSGLTVTGVAAAHEFLDEQNGLYPYLGYVIEGNGCTLFHSGDSCVYEGYLTKLQKWKLDAAFLPINGRDAVRLESGCIGNMTYQEAVDLAGMLRVGLAVPGHYDMFDYNGCDPTLFQEYLRVKYPGVPCWIGNYGEKVTVRKV